MIVSLLTLALFNALYIQGLYHSSLFDWRGDTPYQINVRKAQYSDVDKRGRMILWPLRFHILKNFGDKWSKPLITCPICMASVHSTYIYFIFTPINQQHLIVETLIYVLYIFTLAGMNAVLSSLTRD